MAAAAQHVGPPALGQRHRVLPPAGALDDQRPDRRHRHERVPADVGDGALAGLEGGVGGGVEEQLGAVAAQPQQGAYDVQLGSARLVDDGRLAGGLQQRAAQLPVDRPAVVRVDQRQVPQLAALVGVGDPRHRQLHGLLRQRGRVPRRRERRHERRDLVDQGVVGEHAAHEALDGGVELGDRVGPAGPVLGLPGRLLDVGDGAVGRQRPGADQRLPDQLLGRGVRSGGGAVGGGPGRPSHDGLAPLARALAQQHQPGAHVLGPLGVVRRQRRHRQRPVALAGGVGLVEGGDRQAEASRIAADLVERRQPQVAVERRVLDALGHDRPAGLLEAGHELLGVGPARSLGEHEPADDLDLGGPPGQRAQRRVDGRLHVLAGGVVGRSGRREVGPVDAEGGQHLDERLPQRAPGRVPQRHVGAAHPQRQLGQPVDLGREHLGEHQPLGPRHDVLVGLGRAGQRLPQVGQRPLAGRVDEDPEHVVEHVVAGRAGAQPLLGQLLPGLEDLLDHDPAVVGALGELLEVAARVGQTVGVVDPQAVEHPGADLLEDQLVRRGEDGGLLHAHAGQRRHVEEAAVVELLAGHAPQAEPVVLALEGRQHVAVDPGAGRDRHLVVVVADPVLEQLQVPERLAERRPEHRHQDLAGVVGAVPLHVEPVGVRRLAAQLQQRPPGGVLRLRLADRHVVRDDVEHDPETGPPAGRDHAVERRLPAELGVQRPVVHDVVAVRRPGRGLQVGRAVEVRHAEVGQVGDDRRRVVEAEAGVRVRPTGVRGRAQLDAVGRHGHGAAGRGQVGHGRVLSRASGRPCPVSAVGTAPSESCEPSGPWEQRRVRTPGAAPGPTWPRPRPARPS